VLIPLLVLGVLIAAIVALSSGGGNDGRSDKSSNAPAAPATPEPATPDQPAKPRARATVLAPLAGARGRATATIDGNRLRLTLRGLPDPKGGSYEVWLYNSVVDAVPLGHVDSGRGTITARLPANASDYRFVDVSLEPRDSNSNHSGQSVLRVPLEKIGR
jgi:hypothetical protein